MYDQLRDRPLRVVVDAEEPSELLGAGRASLRGAAAGADGAATFLLGVLGTAAGADVGGTVCLVVFGVLRCGVAKEPGVAGAVR